MSNSCLLDSVTEFTRAVGCTTDRFNVRQTALYIGLQLEEMAEKLEACGLSDLQSPEITCLRVASQHFKAGVFDRHVEKADRGALLDADIDLAWVTLGSALSQGADVSGASAEVARANLDKVPGGVCKKDQNGKVIKPDGWLPPDLTPFVNSGDPVGTANH